MTVADLGSAPPIDPVRDDPAVRRRRPGNVVIAAGLALLAASAVLSARAVDGDSGGDLARLLRLIASDAVRLRWQYAAVVIALAAAHYAATAVAAQAAVDRRLRFSDTVLVQLAASAANRLTPGGLGGAALNARYFSRRGVPMASAVGAVVALSVLGALADGLVLLVLVLTGRWIGLGGAPAEISLLAARISSLVAPLHSAWTWTVVAVLAPGVLIGSCRIRRGRSAARRFCAPILVLLRRPSALLRLLGASGATTVILAVAFVASTAMVPGHHPHASAVALIVGFMLGSAAGGAVPTPAGVGSTETALVAVLVIAGLASTPAVEVVLIFRLITFWAPAAIGVLATRRLRRTGVL